VEPTPFWDRTDVNAVLALILIIIALFGMCMVPPDWYLSL
jgi:hypothetical protein